MSDTDYKKMWRKAKKQIVKLFNMLYTLSQLLETQMDVLRRVRDGQLKPDEIFKDKHVEQSVAEQAKIKEEIKNLNVDKEDNGKL